MIQLGTDSAAAAARVAQSLLPSKSNVAGVKVQADASTGTSTSTTTTTASAGTAITSNDFLSLLVTEMKNQDPTQPTDPNAYIQQLVGVNSLQQLIAINQDLTGSGAANTGSATTSVGSVSGS